MTAWVRYALMVGVILLGGLVVWLVRSSPVVTAPSFSVFETEREPPADSPPLLRSIEFNFDAQGGQPRRNMQQYLAMVELVGRVSKPSSGDWRPYVGAEQVILVDADRLWRSGLLESLWVDVVDEPYPNGVAGRRVVFNFVERDGEAAAPAGPPRVPESYSTLPTGTARLYPR